MWIYNDYNDPKGNIAGVGWNCSLFVLEVYFLIILSGSILYVCLFYLLKKRIQKMCNFPYEVQPCLIFKGPKARWKNNEFLYNYQLLLNNGQVHFQREYISIADSWYRVSANCLLFVNILFHKIRGKAEIDFRISRTWK